MSATRDGQAVPAGIASPQAKLVYLYLDGNGSATTGELAGALDVPHITVLGVLRTLRRREFVRAADGEYALA